MGKLSVGFLLILLAGCFSQAWTKPGGNREDFYRDREDCEAEASRRSGALQDEDAFEACMKSRGYVTR